MSQDKMFSHDIDVLLSVKYQKLNILNILKYQILNY